MGNNNYLIIKYLDSDSLDKLFYYKKHYEFNGSFVKKIDSDNHFLNYKVKLYHNWVHNKPVTEYVANTKQI